MIEQLGNGVKPLLSILKTCRPSESDMGNTVMEMLYERISKLCGDLKFDDYGNLWVSTDPTSTSMFTCHVDTCHFDDKNQTHTLRFYEEAGSIFVGTKDGTCLGADDGTGIWLMLSMIVAGVPGVYVFHRDEEVGCQGSKWIAENLQQDLAGLERAIAFDRKGYHDVVTSQIGKTCCSVEFSDALGEALGFDPAKCNPRGSVTDTAQYMNTIPECTNISVGYFYQHGPRELQNLTFAVKLRKRLLGIDFEKLPTARDPNKRESFSSPFYSNVHNSPPQGDLFSKGPTMAEAAKLLIEHPDLVTKFLYHTAVGEKQLEKYRARFHSEYTGALRQLGLTTTH